MNYESIDGQWDLFWTKITRDTRDCVQTEKLIVYMYSEIREKDTSRACPIILRKGNEPVDSILVVRHRFRLNSGKFTCSNVRKIYYMYNILKTCNI